MKKSEIQKNWVLIDAEGVVLGRLAAYVSILLRGKHKPSYTPHMDCGDKVIIINAEKVVLTGNKYEKKIYYRHTGYPGGIKSDTPRFVLEGRFPERIVSRAVERMLDNGPLSRTRFKNLYVYKGPEHKHQAQMPKTIDFISMNKKNRKAQ